MRWPKAFVRAHAIRHAPVPRPSQTHTQGLSKCPVTTTRSGLTSHTPNTLLSTTTTGTSSKLLPPVAALPHARAAAAVVGVLPAVSLLSDPRIARPDVS